MVQFCEQQTVGQEARFWRAATVNFEDNFSAQLGDWVERELHYFILQYSHNLLSHMHFINTIIHAMINLKEVQVS